MISLDAAKRAGNGNKEYVEGKHVHVRFTANTHTRTHTHTFEVIQCHKNRYPQARTTV